MRGEPQYYQHTQDKNLLAILVEKVANGYIMGHVDRKTGRRDQSKEKFYALPQGWEKVEFTPEIDLGEALKKPIIKQATKIMDELVTNWCFWENLEEDGHFYMDVYKEFIPDILFPPKYLTEEINNHLLKKREQILKKESGLAAETVDYRVNSSAIEEFFEDKVTAHIKANYPEDFADDVTFNGDIAAPLAMLWKEKNLFLDLAKDIEEIIKVKPENLKSEVDKIKE